MKLKVHDGIIYNEDEIVGVITVESESKRQTAANAISAGSDAINSISEFVDGVNSGTLKPRKTVKEFEKILEKIST